MTVITYSTWSVRVPPQAQSRGARSHPPAPQHRPSLHLCIPRSTVLYHTIQRYRVIVLQTLDVKGSGPSDCQACTKLFPWLCSAQVKCRWRRGFRDLDHQPVQLGTPYSACSLSAFDFPTRLSNKSQHTKYNEPGRKATRQAVGTSRGTQQRPKGKGGKKTKDWGRSAPPLYCVLGLIIHSGHGWKKLRRGKLQVLWIHEQAVSCGSLTRAKAESHLAKR